jgi:hypothetical protein
MIENTKPSKALVKTDVSSSINALLSKFDNGLELYQNNAVFANCIEHLLRRGDIYKIFEQILVMQTKTQEKLSELIKSGTLRQEIIVSKEKFDDLIICENITNNLFKEYRCTDCQELNMKKDNREITVGFCDNCGHPLWNTDVD